MNAAQKPDPNSSEPEEFSLDSFAADAVADANAAASSSAELDLTIEIARLEGALREANERNLRTQAELENFRKRSRRELEDERRYAALPLVRDVLNVLDNLQRAIEAAEKSQSGAGLLAGVKMVAVQLTTYLDQHHCLPIAAAGAPFDPNYHEAIGQGPHADVPAGHVSHVARAGYTLYERVVRPAQVFVSTGAPADANS